MNVDNSTRKFPGITTDQLSKDFYGSDHGPRIRLFKGPDSFCALRLKKQDCDLSWPLPGQQGSWTLNKAKESFNVASQLPLGPAKKKRDVKPRVLESVQFSSSQIPGLLTAEKGIRPQGARSALARVSSDGIWEQTPANSTPLAQIPKWLSQCRLAWRGQRVGRRYLSFTTLSRKKQGF